MNKYILPAQFKKILGHPLVRQVSEVVNGVWFLELDKKNMSLYFGNSIYKFSDEVKFINSADEIDFSRLIGKKVTKIQQIDSRSIVITFDKKLNFVVITKDNDKSLSPCLLLSDEWFIRILSNSTIVKLDQIGSIFCSKIQSRWKAKFQLKIKWKI